tara:strand:- start:14635 stop:14880 length:246 start_codon:yes stop_codon:yes gene_type:complete
MKTNFETLWQAFDSIAHSNKSEKLESIEFEEYMHTGGINYGESWTYSFEIDKLKGRNTKKGLQVSIFRNNFGIYEKISYCL